MKNIIITGVAGTVGNAIVEKLLTASTNQDFFIVGLDRSENGIFDLNKKWHDKKNVQFFCEDLLRLSSLDQFLGSSNSIIHAAAMKHVPICQASVGFCIDNNVLLLNRLIEICRNSNVSKFVFCSSDKAVNPTNVMGASKLLGEQICLAASASSNTKIVITRFGNVFGSNGSVGPIFKNYIESGKKLPITNTDMTRFFMSLEEAADLVLFAEANGKSGSIYVPRMAACSVMDLAHLMFESMSKLGTAKKSKLETKIIGERPGEKSFEELMTGIERQKVTEAGCYFEVSSVSKDHELIKQSTVSQVASNEGKNLDEIRNIVERYISESG